MACASGSQRVGELVLSDVAVRIAPAGAETVAIYFTVRNQGAAIDTLRSITSPAGAISLHETMSGNAMMSPLSSVAVPANGDITFAPGQRHGMLEHFSRPLAVGDTLTLDFDFARSGHVVVRTAIRPIAGVE